MKKCKSSNRAFYTAVVTMAAVLSLGCFFLKTDPDPDPDPIENECNGVDAIPEIVDEDFLANDDCDQVEATITVRDGARLTVEPGTTLIFGQGAGVRVEDDASLYARGTDEEPIEFTGSQPEAGHWQGIYFDGTTSRDNFLEHITIEHAGGQTWDDVEPAGPANVSIRSARVEMVDFTLRQSAGYGLYMGGNAVPNDDEELDDDSDKGDNGDNGDESNDDAQVATGGSADIRIDGDNEITANQEEPVRTSPDLIGFLTAETTYQNNDSDFILVTEGTVTEGAVWEAFDVPLLFDGVVTIAANVRISPGVEVVFRDAAGFQINSDGSLDVDGDDDDVVLRGDDAIDDEIDEIDENEDDSTNSAS